MQTQSSLLPGSQLLSRLLGPEQSLFKTETLTQIVDGKHLTDEEDPPLPNNTLFPTSSKLKLINHYPILQTQQHKGEGVFHITISGKTTFATS